MSAAESATPKPTATAAGAVELTVEGLQWMLLLAAATFGMKSDRVLRRVAARGAAVDVWAKAYDAAPDAVRQSLTHSVMATAAGSAWAPAIVAVLTAADIDVTEYGLDTPLRAFAFASAARVDSACADTLCRAVQCCGLIASADRRAMGRALLCARVSPRAFALLIADSNADAALPGPTRCSAGDAHNPPRHHSVRCADEQVTVHGVLYAAAPDPVPWRAFSDARLPFAARAMAEEWAYELTGPCGCAGRQRISKSTNPLHRAIAYASDEAGEWLAVRLPPKRLNERDGYNDTPPLIAALQSTKPVPRTVAALLSRVPGVDVTLRAEWRDKTYTAAEWMAYRPTHWLPPHLAAALKLKTEQFAAQYLPSAAVLCAEALCGAVSLPRELMRLVLQYTALPQPNPWPNAHADVHAIALAAADAVARAPAATTAAAAVSAATAAAD